MKKGVCWVLLFFAVLCLQNNLFGAGFAFENELREINLVADQEERFEKLKAFMQGHGIGVEEEEDEGAPPPPPLAEGLKEATEMFVPGRVGVGPIDPTQVQLRKTDKPERVASPKEAGLMEEIRAFRKGELKRVGERAKKQRHGEAYMKELQAKRARGERLSMIEILKLQMYERRRGMGGEEEMAPEKSSEIPPPPRRKAPPPPRRKKVAPPRPLMPPPPRSW